MESTGKLVWFFAGATMGATIALLYAPQSGKVTRRFIGSKTRKGKDSVVETGRDWMERGRELYQKGLRVADEAAEMMERGRKIVEG